uniref:Eukaryotic translation initiation factor 4C n=1 Tax=Marmota marmota marmota TaxID=9994 RepID=A0A8C5YS72_MARMA
MPKNKGKGGKNRCRGKNENESEKRELVFKEDGQVYAQVIKMLGNGRLEAMCFDGIKRLCHIRGKLRKKVWINSSDIILVGLRDYQVKIIFKFPLESLQLQVYTTMPGFKWIFKKLYIFHYSIIVIHCSSIHFDKITHLWDLISIPIVSTFPPLFPPPFSFLYLSSFHLFVYLFLIGILYIHIKVKFLLV